MVSKAMGTPHPGFEEIFKAWFGIGIQSFGGGSSTLLLIHQTCIAHRWMDEDEFVRSWALVQISPGINLVKFTALIGYRLHGWPGLFAAMAGLLLPSAGTTILMTAGFTLIRDQPVVKAIMRGVLPATIGLSLAMAVQMAQPLISRAFKEGSLRLTANVFILLGAALLLGIWNVSPVIVLLVAGISAILLMAVIPINNRSVENGKKQ
jgi:chromate transporter